MDRARVPELRRAEGPTMEDSCELPTYIAISSCPVMTPGRSQSCRTGSKMRGGDRSDRGPAAHRVRLEKAEPAASRVLRSSRTSPNLRITVASPKWPIAASPLRLKATALRAFAKAPRPLSQRCNQASKAASLRHSAARRNLGPACPPRAARAAPSGVAPSLTMARTTLPGLQPGTEPFSPG